MKKFTKEHEWIQVDGDVGTVGITDYAQKQLGDVVYVTMTRDIGSQISQGEDAAEIESVKSVSQIFTPVSGEILEFNTIFEDETKSGIVNEDPYNAGWIFKLKISNLSDIDSLLSESQYNDYIKNL
ncbi:MAG: glycine cleavage system protein GcvH [Spirochaetes bacterium]|nr:glycine cleavage system protein GcvH [Spirochaetota bacterium]